ncbi:MAG: aldolase/citrate lyase family protein [Phascolarctobacterium sp.]|nr:aldolase/citrate lyase family protein [Phascolarctobacterium sp.]
MALTLMYITNNPVIAQIAQKYGVDRVWVDLETLGKEERQKGLNTVKSKHCINDIRVIKPLLTTSEMLVRVNPWNEKSKHEINEVVAAGADMIMLPMWKSTSDVQHFVDTVAGRAKTTLLLETKEGLECLDEVLAIKGIDEMHIGLNDLHLAYGMTFMFELLADGTVEKICKKIGSSGLPYGFGGIARVGEGTLPAERIIMEHYRLGSTRAILSRSFCNVDSLNCIDDAEPIFRDNMKALRAYEESLKNATQEEFKENIHYVKESVDRIVKSIKEKK